MRHTLTMNNKAVVSSKGQIVIPRILREKFGIHTGDELFFEARTDGVIEIKRLERSIEMFFGRCKRKGEPPMSIKEMDTAIMQAVVEDENSQ